ncbi:cytosine permease [Shouchella lehensis]|uniref:Permease for cytosine/purines uracil thiamine allantoin domain-containing protein n=1 Tax=Shouchella lehensis G1 TaxID=1246626 RepID=A0A060LT44_9BACI|nr:cytosine permease [Shouchella lehensis]AIC94421.1 permease for cytosine/purines uracil thiamine allantoin domain-containing protein [Shouchella lehensis G1]RQW20310.1 cytosine permease [Bacillus sp. C1-1]
MEKQDQEFSWQEVPKTERKHFLKTLAVMLGFTFFSASMLAGGQLGISLTFSQFIVVVLGGNLLLGLYTGALAYIAAKTGLSTHLLAKHAFGEKGSYLPSFLLAFTQVGWFGVGVAMFAVPVAQAMNWNVYVLIFTFGLAMTASAIFGIKALVVLGFVAVPAIAILGGYSVTQGVQDAGGVQTLFAYEPTATMAISAALAICIGSFISGGTLTPDFARFAKTAKQAVSATTIAFFLGNSLMFLFGAVGAMVYGLAEVSEVMFLQGLMIPAILVLGLNIWTTNDNALYASGLGFAHITKLPKKFFVILNGVIGTVLAMWMYNNFVGFLTILGVAIPSIGAILIADYFFIHKRHYPILAEMKVRAVNWIAIVSWAIGVTIAQLAPGIIPLNALIGTMIVYIVCTTVMNTVKKKKELVMTHDYSKRNIAQ